MVAHLQLALLITALVVAAGLDLLEEMPLAQ